MGGGSLARNGNWVRQKNEATATAQLDPSALIELTAPCAVRRSGLAGSARGGGAVAAPEAGVQPGGGELGLGQGLGLELCHERCIPPCSWTGAQSRKLGDEREGGESWGLEGPSAPALMMAVI